MNKTVTQNKGKLRKSRGFAGKNNNFYDFKVNGTKVRAVFSQSPTAPALEDALANIAIRKTD